MNGSKVTTRKVKVLDLDTTEFIRKDTGETEEMQVILVKERDFNFHKLWLGHILNTIDLIGNQKMTISILNYRLSRLRKQTHLYAEKEEKMARQPKLLKLEDNLSNRIVIRR